MTRRERIVVLLENYQDVQPGLVDTDGGDGSGGLNATGCWKSWPYRELDRLRILLRAQQPSLYWHLAEMYFRAGRRRVALCPKCLQTSPPTRIDGLHKCGQRTVTLIPGVERVFPSSVQPERIALAIDWLEENWSGPVDLPADLRGAA